MLINLFEKGKGLEYLQTVYSLLDQQVYDLKDSLYFYSEPRQITEDIADNEIESMWSWLPNEEKQEIKKSIMMSTWPKWQIVDDAVERFIKVTEIKLDDRDLSELLFRCIHVSPVIDGGESIKRSGLRKLTELFENESPIRSFLAEYGIVINPSQRWYSINGERHSIDGTMLEVKLYHTKSEIEAFIAGDIETLKDYSCIETNPEFLRELSPLAGIDLDEEWSKRKNALIYVSFDISFDECANITEIHCPNTPDVFDRLLPYLSKRYNYGEEPVNVWRNYWFINACIENSCPEVRIDRSTMAVREDVTIGPDRLVKFDIVEKICKKKEMLFNDTSRAALSP